MRCRYGVSIFTERFPCGFQEPHPAGVEWSNIYEFTNGKRGQKGRVGGVGRRKRGFELQKDCYGQRLVWCLPVAAHSLEMLQLNLGSEGWMQHSTIASHKSWLSQGGSDRNQTLDTDSTFWLAGN